MQVMKIKEKYTCIGCGYKTLEFDTGYAICVLCGWEDDDSNWEEPRFKGGANGSENLYKHQKRIIRQGFPYYWKKFRNEEGYADEYEIDKHWEPFQEDYLDIRTHQPLSSFPWIWMYASLFAKEDEEQKKKL